MYPVPVLHDTRQFLYEAVRFAPETDPISLKSHNLSHIKEYLQACSVHSGPDTESGHPPALSPEIS